MVKYNVNFSREAVAGLSRLDKPTAQRILNRINWLSLHINDVNHKALTGHLRGEYKLRIGDYRVIYELKQTSAILTVRLIAHRSEVYHLK